MYAHFRAGCVCGASASSSDEDLAPLPHAVAASIARCRDLPSTVARSEARAAPWPPEVREEIWRDRVIFRRLLRGLRGKIAAAGRGTREKMRELVADPSLLSSSSSSLTAGRHVVAGAQIGTFLEDHFPGFYGTLLRKLLQQVVAFSTTGMRYDGTNPAEYAYEGAIAAANTGDIEDSTIYIRVSPCKKCCDEEDGACRLESLISHGSCHREETRAVGAHTLCIFCERENSWGRDLEEHDGASHVLSVGQAPSSTLAGTGNSHASPVPYISVYLGTSIRRDKLRGWDENLPQPAGALFNRTGSYTCGRYGRVDRC